MLPRSRDWDIRGIAGALLVATAARRQQSFAITMDHPFLYAIRDDDTGALLFIGTLLDPSPPTQD
jgi:serine protease inhibitor